MDTIFAKRKMRSPLPEISEIIYQIDTGRIYPNPAQPRKNFDDDAMMQLAESLLDYGMLQPLSVRLLCGTEGCDDALYELIAGERRLRAAKIAGLQKVPCRILSVSPVASAELAIIENTKRVDLNCFEEAKAISLLIAHDHLTQEQAAKMLGKSQSTLANKLRLLQLSAEEQKLITENGLTERHARSVLKIHDPELRLSVLEKAARKGMSVKELEKTVEQAVQEKKKRRVIPVIPNGRIFQNTVNKVVAMMENTGIKVRKETRETENEIQYIIAIEKKNVPHGTKQ